LQVAPLPGRLPFPKHSLTWIVKGTFDLKVNGPAVLAAEQAFPTGEEHYPDDQAKTGGPRYESDFVCFKPRADLLLVGACHAPNGKPVVSCPATFRVGSRAKTLGVLGNRRWEKHWLTWQATAPEPFTRMELRYENSFGGEKFPANPVGKGHGEIPDGQGGHFTPLPNVEDPAHLIVSHGNHPAPAGFGPLSRHWKTRHDKLGTYGGAYRKTRWPWFPEDFDWTHFNAAPPDQQVEAYLRGDEPLGFENLHPRHARYESQLPGLRVRCFVHRLTGVAPGELRFDEVELKLDTLWVDMEAEKLVLVWRGWTPVASEESEDLQHCFIASEPLAQAPAPIDYHYRQFLAHQEAETKPFAPETPPPPPPPPATPAAVPDPAEVAALEQAKAERRKQFEAQTTALNARFGFDQWSPQAQQQTRERQAKLIEHLTGDDPVKAAQLAQAAQQAELRQALGKLGLHPDQLPPLTDQARIARARVLNELGLGGDAIQSDPQLAELTAMVGAVLARVSASPENLEVIVAEARKVKAQLGLPAVVEPTPEEVPASPPLTRESIHAKLATPGALAGADLRGLDLSGLDFKGANLAGANLAGVPLRGAQLQQANLTGANLAGADLTAAELTRVNAAGADFTGAKLHQAILLESDLAQAQLAKADLTKAVLDGALLEAADLRGANLAECSAVGALFPRANLTGVNFQKSAGPKADFTKATLNQANFQGANLAEACVNAALGHQLNLTGAVLTKLRAGGGCDFSGATLTEAQGDGSMWKAATLTSTDWRHAQLKEAVFTSACLRQANLSAADLKFARLNKANLREAKMMRLNLFQGTLQKADLTRADLSGANLYEVEFLEAVLDHTVTEGANLIKTKLEPK